MRGDQLARQWRVIRAIEASLKGLPAAEIAGLDGAQGSGQNRKPLQKPIPKVGMGFFVMGRQSE